MTGFGRGQAQATGLRVTADVRTVNHRYLDVDLRGQSLGPALEQRLRKTVEARLARGKVDVVLALETAPGEAPLRVQRAAMRQVADEMLALAREMDVEGPLTLDHLAQLPWARVVEGSGRELVAEQEQAVVEAVSRALEAVVAVRQREGRELASDIRSRVAALKSAVAGVRRLAEGSAASHFERLRMRMEELVAGLGIDTQRLTQEAALLADRSDVNEELARLEAYAERLAELLDGDGPAGKKLDFTLQEAFREVNTIGSKVRALEASGLVIEMKSELERMREQAANVE